MHTPSNQKTKEIVFLLFHGTNLLLVASSVVVSFLLRDENPFELVMAQLFIYGTLFSLLGAKAGGYLGAVMEEDACSQLDMGVLSSMGSFVGATVFTLIGTAIVGLYLFFPAHWMSWVLSVGYLALTAFFLQKRALVERLSPIDCCGNRLGPDGKILPAQPMKMKNKLAIVLALTLVIEAFLTIFMIAVMRRDLANNTMLGGMMYAMGGAMLGGMVGGWLAGLLDEHTGEPEHDNPIMVCAMALMAGMMGAMPASMVGGMMGLMGALTIIPTIVSALTLFFLCYFWMFKPEFKLQWAPRNIPKIRIGGFVWQKQSESI